MRIDKIPTEYSLKLRDIVVDNRGIIGNIFDRYGASNPRIFGSVAKGTAHEGSDIDFLVDLNTERKLDSMHIIARLEDELKKALNVDVDVVTNNTLSESMKFVLDRAYNRGWIIVV